MPQTVELTVLFAALDGNALYEAVGDDQAFPMVTAAVETLRTAIASGSGRVVKTIGDELLATFDRAEDAARAVEGMRKSLAPLVAGWKAGGGLRAGFAFGPVLLEDGDVFGDTVGIAARAQSLARPGQTVADGEALQQLPVALSASARPVHTINVKSSGRKIEFFALPDAIRA